MQLAPIKISKLALGTVQFGLDYGVANKTGQVALDEVQRILPLAKENGIDVLDTAITYGNSEEVLGKTRLNGFKVVTKLPPLPTNQRDVSLWAWDHVHASLERLGKRKLYGLLLHRPQDLFGWYGDQLIQALSSLKSAGLVQKIGVSIYNPTELDKVYKKTKIDLVQAPLNIVDRRLQMSGWLNRLNDDCVEVHARSVFLQGLLLMRHDKIPQKFSRWSNLWNQWHGYLNRSGISALAACLEYPLSLEQVNRVVIGVNSATQLGKILEVAQDPEDVFDTSFMRSKDLDLINPSNWNYL